MSKSGLRTFLTKELKEVLPPGGKILSINDLVTIFPPSGLIGVEADGTGSRRFAIAAAFLSRQRLVSVKILIRPTWNKRLKPPVIATWW